MICIARVLRCCWHWLPNDNACADPAVGGQQLPCSDGKCHPRSSADDRIATHAASTSARHGLGGPAIRQCHDTSDRQSCWSSERGCVTLGRPVWSRSANQWLAMADASFSTIISNLVIIIITIAIICSVFLLGSTDWLATESYVETFCCGIFLFYIILLLSIYFFCSVNEQCDCVKSWAVLWCVSIVLPSVVDCSTMRYFFNIGVQVSQYQYCNYRAEGERLVLLQLARYILT